MGIKGSKRQCLVYDDAVKRVTKAELKRITEAFKELTDGSNLLRKQLFFENILIGAPSFLAERVFINWGGTLKGISSQDLICGLVLLTKGTDVEKARFLWNVYSNDNGSQISPKEFKRLQKYESPSNLVQQESAFNILFDNGKSENVTFDEFVEIILGYRCLTPFSNWLLNSSNSKVKLTSSTHDPIVDIPTFYQTLAGVTHLNEVDISGLEKHFWALQGYSSTGLIDSEFFTSLISPPIPLKLVVGLFQAFDVNHDGHIDFKELCCGVSSACRGPIGERLKFCFKLFDKDLDSILNMDELNNMKDVIAVIASGEGHDSNLNEELIESSMSLDDFLIWSHNEMKYLSGLIRLLFEVCHISLGLRTQCHHQEFEIVKGWLDRETTRGYSVGQFWYVVSANWWRTWYNYTQSSNHCNCELQPNSYSLSTVEEGVVCDENLTSIDSINDDNSSSTIGDTFSVSSSSGISTSSGFVVKNPKRPGPIDNSALVLQCGDNVRSLTGEGGHLRRDKLLVLHEDYKLVPDSLWKALAHWYGAPLPLPRQVIQLPNKSLEVELYPYRLRLYQHVNASSSHQQSNWKHIVGNNSTSPAFSHAVARSGSRKVLNYAATFSRLSTVKQVLDFVCQHLNLRLEDVRLWLMRDGNRLLDDDAETLEQLGVRENVDILLEIRNKDLTWPEELGALCSNSLRERKTSIVLPPGVVGLLNLGNTCFMNAALQAVCSTRPLTLYFHRDGLSELNCNKPMGTKGQVTRSYANLCRKLWSKDVHSFAPIDLKIALSKYAPHLSGGGQHDSQELLAFLLDALHEDLNRVTEKVYIELQDSDGRPDTVVAAEAWQSHLERDHSIITDLFHGQLKSKVTCQTCGHESVRFDPFNMLSLPLPMENFVLCEMIVIKCDDSVPVKYGIRLSAESSLRALKRDLAQLCDISKSKLLIVEIANSLIRRIYQNDDKLCGDTVLNLYAYELPFSLETVSTYSSIEYGIDHLTIGATVENDEVKSSSPFCMFDILCLKPFRKKQNSLSDTPLIKSDVVNEKRRESTMREIDYQFVVAYHRKNVRQELYFLAHQKTKTSVFGVPLVIGCHENTTCEDLYESIWLQVNRLLSPLPKQELLNHATDCDDSLGYNYPFNLKIVSRNGLVCALCPWTEFCRGCAIECCNDNVFQKFGFVKNREKIQIAIDWEPTALYLRYQPNREKMFVEHESVRRLRRVHNDPIDLDHCLRAFTSEEKLETMYRCSKCDSQEPATKKLQIWRLPPILIIHLKRFDFTKGKWAKTHKMVNFPIECLNPTEYLASVPQETIYKHREIMRNQESNGVENHFSMKRERISTSLIQTPINSENLQDFHQHHLKDSSVNFDLNYHLYAFITHSGLLNGGHYVAYASNPNKKWYVYNDSACRELPMDDSRSQMYMNSAYILFYERSGLNYDPYIPEVNNNDSLSSGGHEDYNSGDFEFKRNCKLS